ncbi:MAG: UvrD-helicase domain-containing protein, partial [Elusimicrobiales bacterium]|nr:UvrD-helicase domain-containing protein [Elusimicrobiales bacterium]
MKNITYISASAGSGKTYAITTKLADIIKEKKAEPEQAILTTFTKAAAAELKEKAKAKLCENGLYEQAERLEQAMIGTAHSVAESFIKKYWHILGLSPELNVMTDEDVDFYRNQSLYTVPKGKELSFLHDFAEEFGIKYKFGSGKYGINYDFWKEHLKTIIEYSINYGITDYEKSKEESKKFITSLCETDLKRENLPNDEEIKKKFNEILKEDAKKTNGAQEKRKKSTESIIRHSRLAFIDLYNLSDIFPGKVKDKDPNLFENLAKIMNTEDARDLQLEYIDIIFAIACRWKESFEQYKKEKRLIDYSDMEKYFVLLLENEEVKKDIKAKYKYLFVDEFQDSSPIQIKFFEALADIMEGGSYWVGDFKQSIYGFRGTDTALVKAVADTISTKQDGCQTATLDTSHRSLPELVNAVNETFVRVFRNILPDKNQVALKPYKDLEEEENKLRREKTEWHSLRFLPLSGGNKEQRSSDLAKYIAEMIQGGENP